MSIKLKVLLLYIFLLSQKRSKQSIDTVFSPVLVGARDTDGPWLLGGFSPRGNWQCERSFGSSVKSRTWKPHEIVSQGRKRADLLMWCEPVKKGFPKPALCCAGAKTARTMVNKDTVRLLSFKSWKIWIKDLNCNFLSAPIMPSSLRVRTSYKHVLLAMPLAKMLF